MLLYDGHPYRMQVTHIAFDPYVPDRIIVATREGGIVASEDAGGTWSTLVGTEGLTYGTGFFFRRDNTVVASSYGRGLWEIDFRVSFRPFPYDHYCVFRNVHCIVRLRGDSGILGRLPEWAKRDVIVILNGTINGLSLSEDRIKVLTVTPGSSYRRYVGQPGLVDPVEVAIVESEEGAGFDERTECKAALAAGELITGVILTDGVVAGILSGPREMGPVPDEPPIIMPFPPTERPALVVRGTIPVAGTAIVAPGEHVVVTARNFNGEKSDSTAVLSLDGVVIDHVEIESDGSAATKVIAPDGLPSLGQHVVEVAQTVKGKPLVAHCTFVVAVLDEGEEDQPD